MAPRIGEEDRQSLRKGPREILADLSEKLPQGLPDLAEEPRITGGGDVLDGRKSRLGKWWKVHIYDLRFPDQSNPLPVRVSSDSTSFYKMVRTNRETTLPDAAIRMLQEGPVVTTKIRIRPSSPLYGKPDLAKKHNDDCDVVYEKGRMFLLRRRPRFAVERRELLAGPPPGPID